MRLRLRFGLVSMNKLPAPNAGGLYKINCHQRERFCRGLSVPFTVNAHGEPCTSGRRGHVSFKLSYHCTGGRIALHTDARACKVSFEQKVKRNIPV